MSTHCNEQSSASIISPLATENNQERKSLAVFVSKLYKMLEDETVEKFISWSENGDKFNVFNPTLFSKEVLPQYFKHNNWQSFVRQLNMYGFHKVNDAITYFAHSNNQIWEFEHPNFKRGDTNNLQNIKRKSSKPQFSNIMRRLSSLSPDNTGEESIYKRILHVEENLQQLNQSCDALVNEASTIRSLVVKQQETIDVFSGLIKSVISENEQSRIVEDRKEYVDRKLHELQEVFDQSFTRINSFVYEHCFSIKSSIPSQSIQQISETTKKLRFGKESHLLNHTNIDKDEYENVKKRRID